MRGRPRDDRREREILATVTTLLADVGYDGVTFEEVARRAGASKATLYRRWSTRRDMVMAALKAGPAARSGPDAIDTGSLRGDLLALCRRLDRTMRSSDGRTAMLLLQAGLEDPELCDEIERSTGPTGARLPASVVEAAVRRGELPIGVDPFPYEEVTGSVLLLRRLNGLPADDHYLESLVDSVLLPALRGTADVRGDLPRGIFSGHPATAPAPVTTEETP
ncbi:TetR family transcriptional regulator [Cellulomonas phragmiteti]|uniref:TetR family transcriptional regulator n=1 Tax=Cellulomonas phragmiteti TaxID=478780 RepID=A0ABQ4DQK7_9CELL|nr:TetR family transcriptional regulator [Cellulomonas phragmiteti]